MPFDIMPIKRDAAAGIAIYAQGDNDKRAEAYLLGLRRDGHVELVRVPLSQVEAELQTFDSDVEVLFEVESKLVATINAEDMDSTLSPQAIADALDALSRLADEEGKGDAS